MTTVPWRKDNSIRPMDDVRLPSTLPPSIVCPRETRTPGIEPIMTRLPSYRARKGMIHDGCKATNPGKQAHRAWVLLPAKTRRRCLFRSGLVIQSFRRLGFSSSLNMINIACVLTKIRISADSDSLLTQHRRFSRAPRTNR